jgi:hypothetical protein
MRKKHVDAAPQHGGGVQVLRRLAGGVEVSGVYLRIKGAREKAVSLPDRRQHTCPVSFKDGGHSLGRACKVRQFPHLPVQGHSS